MQLSKIHHIFKTTGLPEMTIVSFIAIMYKAPGINIHVHWSTRRYSYCEGREAVCKYCACQSPESCSIHTDTA